MQYLGSRVPLNIPHFRDFAATVKFYTHPNDVLGIFSCHNNNSDLCHFQAKWHVTDYNTIYAPQKRCSIM